VPVLATLCDVVADGLRGAGPAAPFFHSPGHAPGLAPAHPAGPR
jgi:hypothetical protein